MSSVGAGPDKPEYYAAALFEDLAALDAIHLVCPISEGGRCGHLLCRECPEACRTHRGGHCPPDKSTICPAASEAIFSIASYNRVVDGVAVRRDHQRVLCLECAASVERRAMDAHLAECPHRKVPCRRCKVTLPLSRLHDHETRTCEALLILCPNGCSGTRMFSRRSMPAHRAMCDREKVACPYAVVGCKTVVERRQLEAHLTSWDGIQAHLLSALGAASVTETKRAAVPSRWQLMQPVGSIRRLADTSARGAANFSSYIVGDTAFFAGRHAWRVLISGLDTNGRDMGIGVLRSDSPASTPTYLSPGVYCFESYAFLRLADGCAEARIGLGDFANGDMVDLLLEPLAGRLSVWTLRDGRRYDIELPRGRSWRPYFYLGRRGNTVSVRILLPESAGKV